MAVALSTFKRYPYWNTAIYVFGVLLSIVLVFGWLTGVKLGADDLSGLNGFTEVFGFLTGAWGGLLLVKNNVWNWPVGIANAGFWLVLFWQSSFFADSMLQIIYLLAGVLGWYLWLRGGPKKLALPTYHGRWQEYAFVAVFTVIATYLMNIVLVIKQDAAPFWDAITTALSLGAYYLQIKRVVENWYIWIAADLIYVPLYSYKHLYLTAVIYVMFIALCIWGVFHWSDDVKREAKVSSVLSGVIS
jgi:nicotinamide mononucleotide transporter